MKKSLSICPTCGGNLKISQYHCPECEIDINGEFDGCMFCNLADEDRYFALVFLQTGGNIRDVERVMGISYPTVKAKLAHLLRSLGVDSDDITDNCCGTGRIEMEVDVEEDELKAHLKEMKKHLKENIKSHVRQHVRHVGGSGFCFRAGGRVERGEAETVMHGEAPSKEKVDSVITDLKDGKIDVNAALAKLRSKKGADE